jgi:uncharacterized protein (DUF1778 family)
MEKSTLSVAMKASERQLLERAAGQQPVSSWVRRVALDEASRIVAMQTIQEERADES